MAKKKKKSRKVTTRPRSSPEPPAPEGINRLGVAVALVLLVGLGVAVAIVGKRPAVTVGDVASEGAPVADAVRDVAVLPTDESLGPRDAPVTIVEFADFQCPFCRQARAALEEVGKLHPDEVKLVFKNFPLDAECNPYVATLHPLACRAARIARCAGRRGRFWKAHDRLFELQDLTEDALDALPGALGLDPREIASCTEEAETAAGIRADIEEARRLGVDGTPTIFINGRETRNFSLGDLKYRVERILSGKS